MAFRCQFLPRVSFSLSQLFFFFWSKFCIGKVWQLFSFSSFLREMNEILWAGFLESDLRMFFFLSISFGLPVYLNVSFFLKCFLLKFNVILPTFLSSNNYIFLFIYLIEFWVFNVPLPTPDFPVCFIDEKCLFFSLSSLRPYFTKSFNFLMNLIYPY